MWFCACVCVTLLYSILGRGITRLQPRTVRIVGGNVLAKDNLLGFMRHLHHPFKKKLDALIFAFPRVLAKDNAAVILGSILVERKAQHDYCTVFLGTVHINPM